MQTILTNARVVLPESDFQGSVVLHDGILAEVSASHYPEGIDLHGAILAPGVIDIHTDYLERELAPRSSARFPLELAMHMVDLRGLNCGLTTICSAARISDDNRGPLGSWRGDGLALARQFQSIIPTLRARHLIHVRWATNFEPVGEILDQLMGLNCIANIVFNDDTPGERQYPDVEGMIRQWAMNGNMTIEEARQRIQERIDRAKACNNRHSVRDHLARSIPLGSHDDTTVKHVIEAHEAGCTLSEMPCSIEAARKARELGMMICMGAPNYYRGGSHCGNLSCVDALQEGLVDMLCSDYHFPSMIACALRMAENGLPLSSAIKLLTLNPARHLGLDHALGSIEVGKQADLVAFHPRNGYADVSHVWVNGINQLTVGAGHATQIHVRATETAQLATVLA